MKLNNIAGRLDTRITLQQVTPSADGAGGFIRAWSDVATVWAEVAPISGKETLEALQLTGITTHRLLVRYRSDITTDKRFLLGSRVLNIRTVMNIENKNYLLEIMAEENVAT